MAASATYSPANSGTMLGVNQLPAFEHSVVWVDGGTAGTIPDEDIPINNVSAGVIVAVGVKFGATAPNTVTVTITDSHGIQIFAGTRTETGRIDLEGINIPYAGVLTVAHSGNTTINATGTTYILVM